MNYVEIIKKVIAEKAGVEPKEITEDLYFEEDLNIGPMELLEILEELEEKVHVDLIEMKADIESVEDLIEIIAEKVE